MSKCCFSHRLPVIVALLSVAAVAQVSPTDSLAASQDIFTALHQRLNGAADGVLARVLADQPWMKLSESAPAGRSSSALDDANARLRAAVERVNHLSPTIAPILRDEGVPTTVSAVVLVESGGVTTALSPKGALGLWQLMPDTAHRYGLIVSAERDERLDVTKSTYAAARYLRDLHRRFGDWQLVFAAYNAGEQAVDRAIVQARRRTFSAIADSLPRETRAYVPAVLRAMSTLRGHAAADTHDLQPNSPNSRGRVLYATLGS